MPWLLVFHNCYLLFLGPPGRPGGFGDRGEAGSMGEKGFRVCCCNFCYVFSKGVDPSLSFIKIYRVIQFDKIFKNTPDLKFTKTWKNLNFEYDVYPRCLNPLFKKKLRVGVVHICKFCTAKKILRKCSKNSSAYYKGKILRLADNF